jgi:hypothetical protein
VLTPLSNLLERLSSAAPVLIYLTAGIVGVLLFYVGVALGVALFHPNERGRRDATHILERLLDFLARRRSR